MNQAAHLICSHLEDFKEGIWPGAFSWNKDLADPTSRVREVVAHNNERTLSSGPITF